MPAFGDRDAWLAIVGLAPGKHGANRTGRPFTGDYAGELLYATLLKFGLAEGEYRANPGDGLQLTGAVILNAVKCLPPANKPEPGEIATCRNYFEAALATLPNVRVLVALGQIAHVAAAKALGVRPLIRPWLGACSARWPHPAVELPLQPLQPEYRPARRQYVRKRVRAGVGHTSRGKPMIIQLIATMAAALSTASSSASCTAVGKYDPMALRFICDSERGWAESVATGDATVVKRILAEDFIGVHPSGRHYRKAEMVEGTPQAPEIFSPMSQATSSFASTAIRPLLRVANLAQKDGRGRPVRMDRHLAQARRQMADRCGRRPDRAG